MFAEDNATTALKGPTRTQMTKCKSLRQPRPTLSWVCLFKTLTNQQTAKDCVCEFKRLFWLVDGKRTPRTPAIPSHTDILLLHRVRYRKLEFSLTPGCSYWDLQQHSALHKNTFCLKLLPGRRIGSKFGTMFVSAAAVTDVHICPENKPWELTLANMTCIRYVHVIELASERKLLK